MKGHFKSGPGNRGRSTCGTTQVAHLEFPRETSIILRCAGKAGNVFINIILISILIKSKYFSNFCCVQGAAPGRIEKAYQDTLGETEKRAYFLVSAGCCVSC